MKKVIIVLLVAVLVAGFAFADGKASDAKFSGSATLSYDYDLDRKDTGLVNAKDAKFNFTFTFVSADGASKGEGKLYAEIEANAAITLVAKDTGIGKDQALTPKATVAIKKANIVAGDLTIDILGPKGLYSYAEFYASTKYDDGKINPEVPFADMFAISGLGLGNHGLRVVYKDYEASFGFWRYGDNEIVGAPAPQTLAYAGVQAPIKFNDDMTLTAGANFFFNKYDDADDPIILVGGGFKFAYAPADKTNKLSASVATDVIDIILDADTSLMPIDISAQVKYDFIAFDAYFFTLDKFDKDSLELFAAKVSADYDVNEQINVGGYAELIWEDLFDDEAKPSFRFGANATYTAEKFTVAGGVDAWLKPEGDDGAYILKGGNYYDNKHKPGLGVWVDVSSDAVIDNATVGISWTDSDFAKDGDEVTALGYISAYATVAF